MSEPSHRERVELAMDHQATDRVPLDFMGAASMIVDQAYFGLLRHLDLEATCDPWRDGFTANYYDERLLEILDIDFRRVWMPRTGGGQNRHLSEDTYVCPWGIHWKRTGLFINPVLAPLAGMDIDDILAYEWPDPKQVWRVEGIREHARKLHQETTHALVARSPVTFGILDRCCLMRGTEQFMMDMLLEPELAHVIVEKVVEMHLGMVAMFLQEVGAFVQIVETADDLGGQENLLISPKLYRQFIKPGQEKVNKLIHMHAPQARIFFHSDGAIFDLIPDLIEIGVDILNPVQSSAKGMQSDRLKAAFGDKLIFHGGLEQKAIEGSLEELREEIRYRIHTLGQEGGYILAPCNNIINASPENVIDLFREAAKVSP